MIVVQNKILAASLLCVLLACFGRAKPFAETSTNFTKANAKDDGILGQRILRPKKRIRCTTMGLDLPSPAESITKRPSSEYTYMEYSSSLETEFECEGRDCGNDKVSPTYVRMTWTELEPTGWLECSSNRRRTALKIKVKLTIDNFAKETMNVALMLTTDVDGKRTQIPLKTNTRLKALSSRTITVAPKISKRDLRQAKSSGRMWISATVVTPKTNNVLESPHSPVVYFHADFGTNTWSIYNRQRLEDTFRGGDYRGALRGGGPRKRIQYARTGMVSTQVDNFGLEEPEESTVLPGLLVDSPLWLVEAHRRIREAQSAQERIPLRRLDIDDFLPDVVKLCFALPARMDDQPFGALGHDESWWAVGLRYGVRNSGGSQYIADGFLARGPYTCFWWSVNSGTIVVDFWLQSKVGGTGRTFHVATSTNNETAAAWMDGNLADEDKEQASVVVSNFAAFATQEPTVVEIDFEPVVSAAHASVVNGLQRLEQLTKRDDEFSDLRVAPYTKNSKNSFANAGKIQLSSKENQVRKFVYEHEVGHTYHQLFYQYRDAFRNPVGANYAVIDESYPGDDNCPSVNSIYHALRSLEGSAAAFSEGRAQFLSTVTLSNYGLSSDDGTAEFKYYKKYPEYGYDFDYVRLFPNDTNTGDGWVTNYLHNVCGCIGSTGDAGGLEGDSYPCSRVGTELDWLRFYWAYLQAPADTSASKPTLLDIMDQVGEVYVSWDPENPGDQNYGGFNQLLEVVQPEFEWRFGCMGCSFGVGGCEIQCNI